MILKRCLVTLAFGFASYSAIAQNADVSDAGIEAAAKAIEVAISSTEEEGDDSSVESYSLDPAIEEVFDRGCGDDNGLDRCDPKIQAKMRGFYGLKSAEELAGEGVDFYRAMLIDGYGNDVVAVSFVRDPGASPYVEIRAPSLTPGEEQSLKTAISEESWHQVATRSANFDSALATELNEDGEVISMCLHGWFAVVEATYRQSPFISSTISFDDDNEEKKETEIVRPDATVRRDAEGSCANGLAMPFAFELIDEARRALAECSNLDLDDFRNAAEMLAMCHRLRGNRLAAAKAYPLVRELELYKRRSGEPELDVSFVDLNDETEAAFKAAIDEAFVVYGAPEASTATDVIVEADKYFFSPENTDMPSEQAKLTLQLYEYGSQFSIMSCSVSPKIPFELPTE